MSKPILVLGAGSWGTALAMVLARNGHTTYIWDCFAEHIDALQKERSNNRHLPGYEFPETLIPVSDFLSILDEVDDVLIAVPCEALRDVLAQLQNANIQNLSLCLACKGLEPQTLSLNTDVVAESCPEVPVAILSGPSFAKEVAAGLPTAVTIASVGLETATHWAERFHSEVFRIYTHDDVVGVQIGGAIKNVMAIAAGIADGLGFGANTRSALITRGLAEIMRLGLAMGGKQETFMGLAGLGDLVLTCTDDQSRNRRFGLALAQGKTPEEAKNEIGQAVEGLRTAAVVDALAKSRQIEMPISEEVYQVILGKISPKDAVQHLLSRERKAELG